MIRSLALVALAAILLAPSAAAQQTGTVTADTTLTMDAPANVARGVQFVLDGYLKDSGGAAVANAVVSIYPDSVYDQSVTTAGDGHWAVPLTLTNAGAHTITASFAGTNALGASHASRLVNATDQLVMTPDPAGSYQRGGTAFLSGRVAGSSGGVGGEGIRATLPWGGTAFGSTDGSGQFRIALTVPTGAPLGSQTITVDDDSHPVTQTLAIDVYAQATLSLSVASGAARAVLDAGGLPVNVYLADVQGQPLGGISIAFALAGPGGRTSFTMTTDGAGHAAATGVLPPNRVDGRYFASATLADSRVHAAPANAQITLGTFSVKWDVPPTALRGKSLSVSATPLIGTDTLPNEAVTLTLFGDHPARTDANGRATWTIPVPTSAPLGPAPAGLRVASEPNAAGVTQTIVQAVPKLNLTPEEQDFDPANGVDVKVTLTDDQNAPMRDRAVNVHLAAGNWTKDQTVITDGSGQWTGHLDTSSAPRANLTVSATHASADVALPASDLKSVPVRTQSVSVAPPGGLPPWLLFGLAAVVVAGGGGAAYYAISKRRPSPSPAPSPSVAPVVVPAHADFELVLGIPPGEPAVWGIKEPLEVQIVPKSGRARPGSHVLLQAALAEPEGSATPRSRAASDDTHGDIMLDEEGAGHVTIVPEREGEHVVRATRDGEVAEATLRVVEYRKAVAEEFDAFVERAKRVDASISRQSTPREVQFVLSARLGAEADDALERMAAIMERTNYSLAPVTRRDYLDFHVARRALEARMPGA